MMPAINHLFRRFRIPIVVLVLLLYTLYRQSYSSWSESRKPSVDVTSPPPLVFETPKSNDAGGPVMDQQKEQAEIERLKELIDHLGSQNAEAGPGVSQDQHTPDSPELLQLEIIANSRGHSRQVEFGTELLPRVRLPRPEKYPVKDPIKLSRKSRVSFTGPVQAKFSELSPQAESTRKERLAIIKEAFMLSWEMYRQNAWGMDEVHPISRTGSNPFMGWAATLIDSLDTIIILDLEDEFNACLTRLNQINFSTSSKHVIPVFESVIRYLGGLISAYDLTSRKHEILLLKATQLAEQVMGAFDTPNRLPLIYFEWSDESTKRHYRPGFSSATAEIGSMTLEFTRLAQITGENKYFDAITRITNALYNLAPVTGIPHLFPTHLDTSGCKVEFSDPANPGEPIEFEDREIIVDHEPVQSQPNPPTNDRAHVLGKRDELQTASDTQTDKEADPGPVHENKRETTKPAKVLPKPQQRFGNDKKIPGNTKSGNTGPLQFKKKSTQSDSKRRHKFVKTTLVKKKSHPVMIQGKTGISGPVQCKPFDGIREVKEHNTYTMGALVDSLYEYFLKEHIILNGEDPRYEELYLEAIEAAEKYLIYKPRVPNNEGILFMGSVKKKDDRVIPSYDMSHLTCYVGGMIALGGKVFDRPEHIKLGEQLTNGCVWAYAATRTGVMPESFEVEGCPMHSEDCVFDEQLARAKLQEKGDVNLIDMGDGIFRWAHKCYDSPLSFVNISPSYHLRPEAVESVFYMYRITGDEQWREKGWEMITSILNLSRVEGHAGQILGFSAVKDVTDDQGRESNLMDVTESFWLAETLKYAYLLFADPSVISLDKFVLSTEAHPLLRE